MPNNAYVRTMPRHVSHHVNHVAAHDRAFGLYVRTVTLAAVGITSAFMMLMLLQLLYPATATTPLLRTGTAKVGGMTDAAVAKQLATLDQTPVIITAAQKTYQSTFAGLGVSVDTAASGKQLLSYPLNERLKPFSLFRRSVPVSMQLQYNEGQLADFVTKISTENVISPKNAKVAKVKGQYKVIDPSENGVTYQTEQILEQIKQLQPLQPVSVTAPVVITEPKVTTEKANQTLTAIKRQSTQKTYVVLDNKTTQIPAAHVSKFIEVSFNKKSGLLEAQYNNAAITAYVLTLADSVYKPVAQSVVTMRDGRIVSRREGRNGQTISVSESVAAIKTGLKENKQNIDLSIKPVVATSQFSRSYSPTSTGLQILLQDWQNDTGLTAGVVVRELNATGRSASINANTQFLPASVSKLYLIHYLYNGIERGSWTAKSKLGTTHTVGQCIERMVVISDNGCFNAIGANRGWSNVASFAQSQGFSSTNPNPSVYTTTANDTALYMSKLYRGSLVSPAHRSQLLGYMRRQIYRTGIPLGSKGSVADKVGYWGGYRHDVAIVYHPKSTYVLSVLTSGSSNAQLADLARRVSSFMDN
ncbi:class A beta-lactamase-related serine hydrolase [Candidatus Saccharibacteria bacterium]|nr:class A beta-lactamase-related serine hydrolase [Candidatus Saccharibacteria bacterium]